MIMSHQAKAEEENRVDMKNSELSATNDLSSVYRWEENKKTFFIVVKKEGWGRKTKIFNINVNKTSSLTFEGKYWSTEVI